MLHHSIKLVHRIYIKEKKYDVLRQPRLVNSSSELCPRMPDKETRDIDETFYTEITVSTQT